MASEDIRKLIDRRKVLREELDKIDNFLELYRELLGENVSVEKAPRSVVSVDKPRRRRGPPPRPGTVGPHDLAPMIRDIMLGNGEPMTRSQLLEALEARNVQLAGADKARYLGTILWRMRHLFINLDGQGYWPIDIAHPGVGYIPPSMQDGVMSLPKIAKG
jgi:hypothetical protein